VGVVSVDGEFFAATKLCGVQVIWQVALEAVCLMRESMDHIFRLVYHLDDSLFCQIKDLTPFLPAN
jgi:hypothetical protein